ncbi:hypothetical protein XF28_25305 [Escherichia coli]|nr:hypothetical protein XF28_25305 [Escherichia coli]
MRSASDKALLPVRAFAHSRLPRHQDRARRVFEQQQRLRPDKFAMFSAADSCFVIRLFPGFMVIAD